MDHAAAKQALLSLHTNGVIWAEDGGPHHLWTRLEAGDLADGATLEEFDALIRSVAEDSASDVYIEPGEGRLGGAIWVVGKASSGEVWLVKVHAGGEVRTAFPREVTAGYLYDMGSRYIGTVRKVLAWTQG